MATLTANGLTLAEVAKRHDPQGNLATIAELLEEKNEILQDAVWREANDVWSHVSTRRAAIPAGSWRKLNQGVGVEKSDTIQVSDSIGILETWAKNDVEIINSFRNPKQARNDEAMAFVEGLGQTIAATLIYGSTVTTPEQFTGLAPRMDTLAAANNVLTAGGSGSDLTSIFVVTWGPNTVHCLYPRNSQAGLSHADMGKQIVQDASANDFLAFVDHFVWKAGLAVKHSKAIGRIANIESAGAANIFDEDDLITLLNRMETGPGTRIYVNDTVMTQMEIRVKDKTNVNYTKMDGLAPGPVLMFKGYPIRQVDQIVITEAALS
jgi:hypothetical protein